MFAAEPSKVPYYIAGGLLALWAVLLAVWGISHGDFPGSQGKGRLVMFTSFLLVVATMASAVLTGGKHAGGAEAVATPRATGRALELAADPGGALRYVKHRAAVLAGRVTVRFRNESTVAHNVTIARGSRRLGATKTITGSTTTLAFGAAARRIRLLLLGRWAPAVRHGRHAHRRVSPRRGVVFGVERGEIARASLASARNMISPSAAASAM
jgi:plastocyanin